MVPRRSAQAPQDRPQRRAAPREEGTHRILRRLFQQGLGQIGVQDEVGGPAGRIDSGTGIDNEAQGQPIWVCRGLRGTWQERWPAFRHYG